MARNDDQSGSRTPRAANAPGAKDGPRDDQQVRAQERERNDLAGTRDYQEGPDADRSGRGDTDRTGTARRAEGAAGQPGEAGTRGDTERAFEQSRGERSTRPEPDEGGFGNG